MGSLFLEPHWFSTLAVVLRHSSSAGAGLGPVGPVATRGTALERRERRLSGLPHDPPRVSHYVPVSDY